MKSLLYEQTFFMNTNVIDSFFSSLIFANGCCCLKIILLKYCIIPTKICNFLKQ